MASRADEQDLNRACIGEEPDYEQLIDDYTHFAPPHDGELLQGRVVKLHEKDVIVDFGYKSEGLVPIEQFAQPDGSVHVQVGDVIDVMVDRQGRAAGRLHPAVTREGQPPAVLGQSGEGASRRAGGVGPRDGPHQRRTVGGRGRAGLHARLADRHAPDAQSGFAARPGHSGQNRQAESAPRQRGGVAQDGGGRRAARPARARRCRCSKKARSLPASSRT